MKMILDLDTGIDDALAIAYALGLPGVELIGVTNCFGNVTIDIAVQNTLDLLELLGHPEVPVFEGASRPWGADGYTLAPHKFKIHGQNGIGNVELPRAKAQKSAVSAVDFILDSARRYGPDLALVATAPLTNLANAIAKDKNAVGRIGRISIMGGALTVPGNRTPFAEANICDDARAARAVMESGIPLTLVGLDATLKTRVTGRDIDLWRQLGTPAADAVIRMCEYYYTNEYDDASFGGAIHDPLAVEVAVAPESAAYLPINLTVETEGPGAGRVIGDLRRLDQKEKSARVCVDVDGPAFVKKFVDTIGGLLAEQR